MDNRIGFIHEKVDIKILILFVLSRVPFPIDADTLANQTLIDDGISYFDFADCVKELVESGHISFEAGKYSITEKGRDNIEITGDGLRYTVRRNAVKSLEKLSAEMNRASMIKTYKTLHRGGGYTVSLKMSDGVGEIISLELFAVNEKQAEEFENSFREKAETIYNSILAQLENKKE